MNKEDQISICAWAQDTFGTPRKETAVVRMLQEIQELTREVLSAKRPKGKRLSVAKESADVLITLYRIADVYGFSLHSEVDKKMEINRARSWTVTKGVGQHIKEEA